MTADQEELLRDVHECLIGNKLRGHRGLVDRVDILENRQAHLDEQLKKKANKINWMSIFKFLSKVKPV